MIRIIAIVTACLAATAARAEICNQQGSRLNFSGSGEHALIFAVRAGATCESTFGNINGANSLIVFKRLLIVSQPSRGKLKLREGGYFIYTAPSSAGSDSFTLKLCGTQDNQPGCATIKYTVAVN